MASIESSTAGLSSPPSLGVSSSSCLLTRTLWSVEVARIADPDAGACAMGGRLIASALVCFLPQTRSAEWSEGKYTTDRKVKHSCTETQAIRRPFLKGLLLRN